MNAPPRTLLTLKRATPSNDTTEERLQKVLANAGLGSRRLLEERIEAGEIRVNGNVAELGSSVHAGDRVELDGKLFVTVNDSAEHAQVLVFNKPEGVVTTRDDPEGRPTVFEQLPRLKGARWIAVGRLDINTTGLLLLTTDGALAHALMHPSTEVDREYICRVHGEVTDEALENLRSGVEREDGLARFEELAVISRGDSHSWFRVVVREGRNREVRRMWESQGLMVSRLKRIRYGNVELPRGLLKGRSETLEPEQVKSLRTLVGAGEPEPTLTLQPVIGQRRAKPSNEFRPVPRAQQALTGGGDEARELRAFDRIRDDAPFSRPGGKRKKGGKKPRPGAGANAGRPAGPRPPRRGAGRNTAGQPQIGIYQPPRPGFTNESGGFDAGRPPRRRGKRPPRPGGAGHIADKTAVRAVATIVHVRPAAVVAAAMAGQGRTASEIPSDMKIASVGRALAAPDRIAGPALRTDCHPAATSSHAVSTISRRRARYRQPHRQRPPWQRSRWVPPAAPSTAAVGIVGARLRPHRRYEQKRRRKFLRRFSSVLKLQQRFSRA
jgi:23S rRNA pseudouridine2605 synthase